MLKAIFGLLGLAVVLAIVGSLAKNQLGAIGHIGQAAERVLGPAGRTAGGRLHRTRIPRIPARTVRYRPRGRQDQRRTKTP